MKTARGWIAQTRPTAFVHLYEIAADSKIV